MVIPDDSLSRLESRERKEEIRDPEEFGKILAIISWIPDNPSATATGFPG